MQHSIRKSLFVARDRRQTVRGFWVWVIALILSETIAAMGDTMVFTGPVLFHRSLHNAELLANGKVLVIGGVGTNTYSMTNCEIFDPSTTLWSSTGSLKIPRAFRASSALLPNGKLMVIGGIDYQLLTYPGGWEIYDPSTGAWSNRTTTASSRDYFTTTLLNNGRVLVTGGQVGLGADLNAYWFTETNSTSIAQMGVARAHHTANKLNDGRVLVSGGENAASGSLSNSQIYTVGSGWTFTGSMRIRRKDHTSVKLFDGRVLVIGGVVTPTNGVPEVSATTEIYDPSTGKWTSGSSMSVARVNNTATLLSNGKVLVTGGVGTNDNVLSSCEVYSPATGTWTNTVSMARARRSHTATLLQSGAVLIVGGQGIQSPNNPERAELYTPTVASGGTISLQENYSSPGVFIFTFNSQPGASFSVFSSANLIAPRVEWATVGGVIEIGPGSYRFQDSFALTNQSKFYYVRSP